MANTSEVSNKLRALESENKRLKIENQKLQKSVRMASSKKTSSSRQFWKKFGSVLFGSIAVALLVSGSLLFWAGSTLVQNDRFTQATSPIIKNEAVQTAVATYVTQRLYTDFDAEAYISEALPPRAAFIAPTLASQLETQTSNVLKTVLQNPTFQAKWNTALSSTHDRFISAIESYGSDGIFSLNELYQELANSLKSTRLSFLADRQLPAKVGSVHLLDVNWISTVYKLVNNIDLWRTFAVILFFFTAALSIYLSNKRRQTVIRLSIVGSAALFATLVSLRIFREAAAGSVDPTYSEAVRQVVQIVFHSLVIQLLTLIAALLIIALVAWMGGPAKSALSTRTKLSYLLNGKLHTAIFSKENGFSRWLGRYKRHIEWLVVAAMAVTMLFTRLTPTLLAMYVAVLVLVIAVVETLATPKNRM